MSTVWLYVLDIFELTLIVVSVTFPASGETKLLADWRYRPVGLLHPMAKCFPVRSFLRWLLTTVREQAWTYDFWLSELQIYDLIFFYRILDYAFLEFAFASSYDGWILVLSVFVI